MRAFGLGFKVNVRGNPGLLRGLGFFVLDKHEIGIGDPMHFVKACDQRRWIQFGVDFVLGDRRMFSRFGASFWYLVHEWFRWYDDSMSRLDGFGNFLADRQRFATFVVFMGALVYALSYWLNHQLFVQMEFNQRVNWLFIPSGVRLVLVLLLDHLGALGIVVGSLIIEWAYYSKDMTLSSAVSPLISGFAPLLAKWALERWLNVGVNLERLTPKSLTLCALGFAFFCSTLHQVWFAIQACQFFDATAWVPMFVGDVMGNLLVLCLIWTVARLARKRAR